MKLAIVLAAALILNGCAASTPVTPATPAAPQSPDLTFARALLDAQAAIEQARPLAVSDPTVKPVYNKVVALYNAAESAYLVYHGAIASGATPDVTALQGQITQLTGQVAALVTLFGSGK